MDVGNNEWVSGLQLLAALLFATNILSNYHSPNTVYSLFYSVSCQTTKQIKFFEASYIVHFLLYCFCNLKGKINNVEWLILKIYDKIIAIVLIFVGVEP